MRKLAQKKSIMIILLVSVAVLFLFGYVIFGNRSIVYADTSENYTSVDELFTFSLNSDKASYSIKTKSREIEEVTIPSTYKDLPVTAILDSGFSNCSNLKEVTLSKNLKKIGRNAFANCRKLDTVLGLIFVEDIGSNAFANCISYAPIVPHLKAAGSTIFRNNPNKIYSRMSESEVKALNSNWDASMAETGETIFVEEDALVYTELKEDDELIGYSVRSGQNIDDKSEDDFVIPSTYQGYPVLELEPYAFAFSQFKSITLKHVDENASHYINVRSGAFAGVEAKSINIEVDITVNDSDMIYGEFAFENGKSELIFESCTAELIKIPDSFSVIPRQMFANCINLKTIINTNPQIDANHISTNIYAIGSGAFEDCAFVNLYLPNTIDMMGAQVFRSWGKEQRGVCQTVYVDLYKPNAEWNEEWKGEVEDLVSFEFNKYTVVLDKEGGLDDIGSTHVDVALSTDMPEAIAPEKPGYAFGGYFTERNGLGTQYYDSDMASVKEWNIENEDAVLFAKWDIIVYNIMYEVPGYLGTINNTNPSKYTVLNYSDIMIEDTTFNSIYSTNNDGISYCVKWDKSCISDGTIGDITVKGEVYAIVKENCQKIHVDNKFRSLIVDLPNSLNKECEIVAEHGLQVLGIVGKGDYVYPLSVNIKSLTDSSSVEDTARFAMIISNLRMKAPAEHNAITVPIYYAFDLYTMGVVEIIGGDGAIVKNKDGNKGKDAISCGVLNIVSSDNLLIRGGDGSIGSGTKKIDEYKNGTTVVKTVGCDGGDGGNAICSMKNSITIYSGNIVIKGGDGGDGVSNGINSGFGGRAGKAFVGGAGDIYVYINEEVQDTVSYENGTNGQDGYTGFVPDPVIPNPGKPDPIIPPGPINPIFPPNPPIIIR